MNMSYCRFTNTLIALRECDLALEEEGIEKLSDEERKSAQRLIKLCGDMFNAFDDEVSHGD